MVDCSTAVQTTWPAYQLMINRSHVLLSTLLQLFVAPQVRSFPDTLFTKSAIYVLCYFWTRSAWCPITTGLSVSLSFSLSPAALIETDYSSPNFRALAGTFCGWWSPLCCYALSDTTLLTWMDGFDVLYWRHIVTDLLQCHPGSTCYSYRRVLRPSQSV